MKARTEKGWCIVGKTGIYYYAFGPSRKAAIERHLSDLGYNWAYHKRKGDRCVKAELRYK